MKLQVNGEDVKIRNFRKRIEASQKISPKEDLSGQVTQRRIFD